MPSLESSPPQALWELTILGSVYPPLEGFIKRFCFWFTNFDELEERWLWLNLSYCQLAHNNESLRASQSKYWRPWPCWGHYWRGNKVSRLSRLNYYWPGVAFTSKFWSSLYYFFDIKWKLTNVFHPQTDSQIKRQNSTMKAYFPAFVNFKQNDWSRLLPTAEFAYNNAKNASIGYTFFELNCGYHPCVSYEEDLDLRSKLRTAEELSSELQKLITVCQQNFYHAQKLQKWGHNKGIKPHSYSSGDKVWLSSKYLKTKRNCKLKVKFLDRFQMLYLVSKQAYKLKLPKKWKIHNVFHISLLG